MPNTNPDDRDAIFEELIDADPRDLFANALEKRKRKEFDSSDPALSSAVPHGTEVSGKAEPRALDEILPSDRDNEQPLQRGKRFWDGRIFTDARKALGRNRLLMKGARPAVWMLERLKLVGGSQSRTDDGAKNTQTVIYASIVVVACVGTYTIPAFITGAPSPQLREEVAKRQWEAIDNGIAEGQPTQPFELPAAARRNIAPASGGSNAGTSPTSPEQKSTTDATLIELEEAWAKDHSSLALLKRMVAAYRARGNVRRARELAAEGFRLTQGDPAQRQYFWDLYLQLPLKSLG
jgi:hypothetical protein